MPSPQAPMMQMLAKSRFQSFRLKLRTVVSRGGPAPTGAVSRVLASGVFGAAAPRRAPVSVPPGFFLAASDDPRDLDYQKTMNDRFESYINGICAAICSGWKQWQAAATLVDVRINACTATGGRIIAPPIYNLILAGAPRDGAWFLKRSDAIASGIDRCFCQYQNSIATPGMPWYPAFVAFPGPMAPPQPNVPCPLVALGGMQFVTAFALKGMMLARFDGSEDYTAELFDSISTAVATCFTTWLATTMVTNVLGSGPIPTFAPPYVPVGPVVGGTGTMMPGGFV